MLGDTEGGKQGLRCSRGMPYALFKTVFMLYNCSCLEMCISKWLLSGINRQQQAQWVGGLMSICVMHVITVNGTVAVKKLFFGPPSE